MSRVLFVALDEEKVTAACQSAKVGISAIERLPAGGVRLVCMSGEGTAKMSKQLKSHLIKEGATRELHRPANPLW